MASIGISLTGDVRHFLVDDDLSAAEQRAVLDIADEDLTLTNHRSGAESL